MRLIDADALIEQIKHDTPLSDVFEKTMCRYITNAPTVDARPVKRGKWTLNRDGSGKCSECGYVQPGCWDMDNWDNFCHHCGADMR